MGVTRASCATPSADISLSRCSRTGLRAYRSVGFIITHPPALSAEASGTWNGATGVAVTVLGLLLALAAIPPLDGARWWQIDGQTLARVPGAGSSGDGGDGIEVSRL